MLFGTIFDLPAFKATIVLMDYEVRFCLYKEIIVQMVWKVDKFVGGRLKQCGGIHFEHAGEYTFMLKFGSLNYFYERPELERHVQGRFISQRHWDILPFGIFDSEPVIRGLGLAHQAAFFDFFLLQQIVQGPLPVAHREDLGSPLSHFLCGHRSFNVS